MRAFLYVLVIVSFFSCSETTIVKQGNTLNLEVTMYTSKKFDLSEMYDSLECVILETNEQSLLADRAYLLYADEENMFVKSDNKVYRFDKQGHFLNSIGQIGNAPGEYNIAYSISVNRYNNSLVYYIGQNTIQLWSYEGQFLKEIKLSHQGEITAVRMLGTDRLVAECRIYHDEGLLTKLCQFDLKGNLLKSTEVSNDNISVSRSMHTMPLLYNYRQSVKYKETHGSGLYEIKEDMYRLQWKIDLGKYAPTREVVEDMNRSEALMRDYAQLVDMQESTDCFFFLVVHDRLVRGIVIDKASGEVTYSDVMLPPQRGGGMNNDWITGTRFWPSFIDDNDALYGLMSVGNLTDEAKEDLKKYTGGTSELLPESNPVVIKIRKAVVK